MLINDTVCRVVSKSTSEIMLVDKFRRLGRLGWLSSFDRDPGAQRIWTAAMVPSLRSAEHTRRPIFQRRGFVINQANHHDHSTDLI